MTATGDRQRGVLLAATGENPMTIDTPFPLHSAALTQSSPRRTGLVPIGLPPSNTPGTDEEVQHLRCFGYP
jgi:hypothetical protein